MDSRRRSSASHGKAARGSTSPCPSSSRRSRIAHSASDRARAAGAANTLKRDGDGWYADNTDGAGIVRDLTANLDVTLAGRDVLVLGAGGAARGILLPMFGENVRALVVSNRTAAKADALAATFASRGPIEAVKPDALGARKFDVVINATSAGLKGDVAWPWADGLFRSGAFAYDMIYGDGDTMFVRWARAQGVTRTADGIGMLVEQAAESFHLWRGVRPATAPVFSLLRPS